jgi:glycosyltransferase involved in cell wall biosynthesis
MHVLFLHQNFPAQFGVVAGRLVREGHRVTFITQSQSGNVGGIERIGYEPRGGATPRTHYSSRTFENLVWHSHAVYDALKARPDIVPDLVVGHAGFVSTALLRELFECPMVNYFEYYYHNKNSDLDFRPDVPVVEEDCLRSYFRNAALLLDLANCDLGYSPTRWQRDRLPSLFHSKVRIIFDGIDTTVWHPQPRVSGERRAGNLVVPAGVPLVTYVARGFESIRGFDVFMKAAKRIYQQMPTARFLVVGEDRICYGGDEKRTGGLTYKQWVLKQDEYDLSKFAFVGRVPPLVLAQMLAMTDLHIYLTVPFVLSWSMMNALACGATVLASGTEPVCEMIEHERNGLLADFFDVDGLAEIGCRVLRKPDEFHELGQAAAQRIQEQYSLEVCLPQMMRLYDDAASIRKQVNPLQPRPSTSQDRSQSVDIEKS